MSESALAPVQNSSAGTDGLAGKYLTFHLTGEVYGIEILKIQEIIGIMSVTKVPRTPGYVRGVVNLRGKVIPVIDLRVKFAMEAKEDTERTCIIVVQIPSGSGTVTIGLIVDEVADVLYIPPEQIEPTPTFGANLDTEFILGMGKIADRVVALLDIERVLSVTEMAGLAGKA